MALSTDLGPLLRSCLLGTEAGPCMSCKKCLRKDLITAGLEDRELDPRLLANLTPDHVAVKEFLEPPPYYFQHVVEFGLAQARGLERTFLAKAKAALNPTTESTEWTTRYYRPAIENDVPPQLRAGVQGRLESAVAYMTPVDEQVVEAWDAASRVQPQLRL